MSFVMSPGKPLLPCKTVLIGLPPGAEAQSVDVRPAQPQRIAGTFHISPTPCFMRLDVDDSLNVAHRDDWERSYRSVYSCDAGYPSRAARIIGRGTLESYNYIAVQVCPFRYYPRSGRVYFLDSIKLAVSYFDSHNTKDVPSDGAPLRRGAGESRAAEQLVNFRSVSRLYPRRQPPLRELPDTQDYVIITTSSLEDDVLASNFVPWKTSLGFHVRIVRTDDAEITSQPGADLAEKIRNFLRSTYLQWGIEYVLMVGDLDDVPMRYCYPDATNHQFDPDNISTSSGEVPTDYYYADLSYADALSWDSDGDGYYGEYGQDTPDFFPEVSVGRIPTSLGPWITYALNKSVAFEQDTGGWKNSALHAGAVLFFENEDYSGYPFCDGPRLPDAIESACMTGWNVSHYSEQEGLTTSLFPWPAISETAFISDWRTGQYSIVNWAAHGGATGASRTIWSFDDGDGVPESSELSHPALITSWSDLDDDYPSLVFAVSCRVGYPEVSNGLGKLLLCYPQMGAAVGVVSASRPAAVGGDWPAVPGGSDSICYEYNVNMINDHERVGQALYDSKSYCTLNYGWDHWYEYLNLFDYNLYGDPSLIQEGVVPDPPDSLTLLGPTVGRAGVEYEYSFSADVHNGNDVYYFIDWGDGAFEEWIGPFSAGETQTATHRWSSPGAYRARVRARDRYDLECGWVELEFHALRDQVPIRLQHDH